MSSLYLSPEGPVCGFRGAAASLSTLGVLIKSPLHFGMALTPRCVLLTHLKVSQGFLPDFLLHLFAQASHWEAEAGCTRLVGVCAHAHAQLSSTLCVFSKQDV